MSQFSDFLYHKIARKMTKIERNQSKIEKNIICLTYMYFQAKQKIQKLCSLKIALDSVQIDVLLEKNSEKCTHKNS